MDRIKDDYTPAELLAKKPWLHEKITQLQNNDPEVFVLGISTGDKVNRNMIALSNALINNTYLTRLELTACMIRDRGLISLAGALAQNHTLKELIIVSDEFGKDGLQALVNALHVNTTLIELRISQSDLSQDGVTVLGSLLRAPCMLRSLHLPGNRLGTQVREFADSIRTNTNLVELNLSSNGIDDDGIGFIAKALQVNRTIERIDLRNNNFHNTPFCYSMQQNSSILDLPHLSLYNSRHKMWYERIIQRNKDAQNRCRQAVMQVAFLGGIPKDDLEFLDESAHTPIFKLDALARKSILLRHAIFLWLTRADPVWWTPEQRLEAGLQTEEELGPYTKKKCIQCQIGKAMFHEEDAPSRLFCGSYCQWIQHMGAPDLRGKTPAEITKLLR